MMELRMTTASQTPTIEAKLKLHRDAQSLQDEWAGVTDPVRRRKLQNRLNQRAARRRKAAISRLESVPVEDGVHERPPQRTDQGPLAAMIIERANAVQRCQSASITFRSLPEAHAWPPQLKALVHDRSHRVQSLYKRIMTERNNCDRNPLPADHLLSLVYYNVYRALVANVRLLGLDLGLMSTPDYPSPFTPCSPTASSILERLPYTLQPTELQESVAHHPQWDIVPDPVCRDNLLRRGQDVDISNVELCLDMIGTEERRQRAGKGPVPSGCIVWGDPWDLSSWEITETLVRKYPWLFVGAGDLEASTNAHRAKRDEEPLSFAELGVTEV